MREVDVAEITEAVAEMSRQSNTNLPGDVFAALADARARETSPIASEVLDQLLLNAERAEATGLPLCQDTGVAVVFVDLGQDAHLVGGGLQEAVDAGVRRGYEEGYLRKSVVRDPLDRSTNTGDNTPAVVHLRLVPGDRVTVHFAPKGGGSENMSALWMLTPSQGRQGVVEAIAAQISAAGGMPCPPLVLGIGLGGTFELSALLAKRALLRPLGEPSPLSEVAELEREVLEAVNATGVGPMGLGGNTTALAVHIERHPCHIASLPLALNVQCHAARHMTRVL
ncbi:MAG: fumarate hydratase [candidate division WS1 bacterium]|jgi:fumarate hydratase subunit alpha|nr:fumarate hydratase [candidate division WS1 bacterium]